MSQLSRPDLQLAKAHRLLGQAWDSVGEGWRDEARQTYQAEFVEPLLQATEDALRAMEDLELLLDKVIRACQ